MDDLIALLDESVESNRARQSEDAELSSSGIHSNRNQRRREDSPAQQIAASADDRIGVRMINRRVSGLDVMNMISDRPYHSPAQLSAYSLVCLNKLLVDPAIVIDPASVCGRTELLTVGIVFTNSGTRLSASGHAFCILTVGNLKSGPCVSLLLFGESYGKHCRTCLPGKVVALINPRLIPPKNGGTFDRTSVTFSVSEARQLVVVADARDYGMCKSMTRAKNEQGHWVSNGKQCQNYIDKRLGEYCTHHQKQATIIAGKASLSTANAAKTGSSSSIQQVRMQSSAFAATIGQGHQSRPFRANLTTGTQNARNGHAVTSNRVAGHMSQRQPAVGVIRDQIFKRESETTLLQQLISKPSTKYQEVSHAQRSAIVRPILSADNLRSNSIPGTTGASGSGRLQTEKSVKQSSRSYSSTTSSSVARNIFEQPKPKGINDKKRKRAVNLDTLGFQGSVRVPAPSRLFRPHGTLESAHQLPYRVQQPLTKCLKSLESVREQQQLVAMRLEERKTNVDKKVLLEHKSNLTKEKATISPPPLNDLFGPLDENSRNIILSAKSRFASEADAEEYARSRRVVNELEQEEAKKSKKVKDAENSIEKEWYCHTCNQTFRVKPVACLRSEHRVKMERKIRAAQSVEEQRIKLTVKKTEDGGLVLGKGLEWSAR